MARDTPQEAFLVARRRAVLAILFACGFLLAVGWAAAAIWTARNASMEVARSERVMAVADALFATLTAAESAQRGYLLTGEETDAAAYRAAAAGAGERIASLPGQLQAAGVRAEAGAVAALASQRLDELAATARARANGGMEAAKLGMAADRGPRVMAEIAARIGSLRAGEETLRAARLASADAASASAAGALLLAALLGIALALQGVAQSLQIARARLRRIGVEDAGLVGLFLLRPETE